LILDAACRPLKSRHCYAARDASVACLLMRPALRVGASDAVIFDYRLSTAGWRIRVMKSGRTIASCPIFFVIRFAGVSDDAFNAKTARVCQIFG
jgi:hypothetical protein